jgi:hypothetical protein
VCEWGWAGLERSQVNTSPVECPQRRTVWSAEKAKAVTGPLCAANKPDKKGSKETMKDVLGKYPLY